MDIPSEALLGWLRGKFGKQVGYVAPPVRLAGGFDTVIDASGCIVTPGLINMHQHHWYTLFKGIADGLLLEDWVTDILLPLSLKLDTEAMRVSSYLAAMEMLATGTTCSFNHSVTTTTADTVRATIEPQAEVGIRQVFAKELRCKTPGNPRHPLSLDEALADFEVEVRRWNGQRDGLVRLGIAIESNAHWVAAGMSTEELICRGYEFARKHGLKITAHIAGGTFSLEKGFLKYLLFVEETPLKARVKGTAGFAEYFAALGPKDARGRSLREFDLESRLFKYPCSFLIYTEAFDLLPKPMREHVLQRLHEVLTGKDSSPEFASLAPERRRAILEILVATKPNLPGYWRGERASATP